MIYYYYYTAIQNMEFLVGYACLKDITKGVFDKYMIPFAQQLAKDGKIQQSVVIYVMILRMLLFFVHVCGCLLMHSSTLISCVLLLVSCSTGRQITMRTLHEHNGDWYP
jgi:hypothetical protein